MKAMNLVLHVGKSSVHRKNAATLGYYCQLPYVLEHAFDPSEENFCCFDLLSFLWNLEFWSYFGSLGPKSAYVYGRGCEKIEL